MKAVNLIPTEHRRATPSGQSRSGASYAVLGGLAVVLVMAVAYVLTANSANERSTQVAKASQEADAYEAQTKNLESFTDFASIKNQRLAAVVAASQTRFDWERLMREVSYVMPDGSWLQETSASVTGDTDAASTPAATTPGATVVAASPSATFVGCTPRQSEVAKILVRLRAMHRVADVKLNESSVEATSAEVTVDSCGPLYKFDLTVTFDPAPPAEAPLGSKSVPASLGGGS